MAHTNLLPSFNRYIESTRHLLLYQFDSSYPLPTKLHFPNVQTLSLIHCSPESVSRLLRPSYFPSLKRLHYLSAAPTDMTIHRRFGSLDWVFPKTNNPYLFYNTMTEAGFGRHEYGLVEQYLVYHTSRKKCPFDLYLPMRGIVYGDWYQSQQMAYLYKKHCDEWKIPYQLGDDEWNHISPMSTQAVLNSRWIYGQKHIGKMFEKTVLNLPDATPFHS